MEENFSIVRERLLEAEGEMCWLLPSFIIQSFSNVFYLPKAKWQGSLGNLVFCHTDQSPVKTGNRAESNVPAQETAY